MYLYPIWDVPYMVTFLSLLEHNFSFSSSLGGELILLYYFVVSVAFKSYWKTNMCAIYSTIQIQYF